MVFLLLLIHNQEKEETDNQVAVVQVLGMKNDLDIMQFLDLSMCCETIYQ